MAAYDILGNVAIVKFDENVKISEKKKFAAKLMKQKKGVRTVLEKTGKFSGRLRTLKTKYVLGEKTKEALYKENGCEFRLNVDSCYFSPRLGSERLELAKKIKKGEDVLVMFSGVAPFGVVAAKKSKAKDVVCVELSRECNKYAKENVRRNRVSDRVEIVQGDVRKVLKNNLVMLKLESEEKKRSLDKSTRSARGAHNLNFGGGNRTSTRTVASSLKYDKIIMSRPNLKDSFLDVAFKVVKKGGLIYYYGFYSIEEAEKEKKLRELVLEEAKKARKKVKILKMKRAGDIAPYKFRYRIDVKVLN